MDATTAQNDAMVAACTIRVFTTRSCFTSGCEFHEHTARPCGRRGLRAPRLLEATAGRCAFALGPQGEQVTLAPADPDARFGRLVPILVRARRSEHSRSDVSLLVTRVRAFA